MSSPPQSRPVRALLLAGFAMALAAGAEAAVGDGLSVYLTLTSDYVYRGISMSGEDPALQGGVDFELPVGFFVGVWASNVDFGSSGEPRDVEVDYYVGFRRQLSRGWSGDVTLLRYTFPGGGALHDYDYNELLLSAHYRGRVSLGLAYSNEVLGFEREALTYDVSLHQPLARGLALTAGLGYFDVSDLLGEGYSYWNLGLRKSLRRWSFDLGFFDTGGAAERFFGDIARERLVVSVSVAVE